MADLRLEEVALDAVIAKLQAGWADRIGRINAEKADGMLCLAPDLSSYYIGRMKQVPLYPACFVMPGPTVFREEGAHSMTTKQQINVWVCESDATGPLLARRLLRQVRAVIEVLYDDAPMESAYVAGSDTRVGPYRIFPKETRPGVIFQQPQGEQSWLAATLIVFTAEQDEMSSNG
jgi:hypothetical protein